MMLVTRWLVWALITPGLPLGYVTVRAYVALKKRYSEGPIAGTYDEEFLGFSALWAAVFWFVLIYLGFV